MRAGVGAALLATAVAVSAQQKQVDLDTPFVTTPANVVQAMLDVARVGPGDALIDLGSGDGRIVIAAAKRGASAVGVEINPVLVERSRENAKREGVDARTRFVTEDLFETDFSRADVVTMYLLPDVNAKLAPKLYATLKPGARIVSHDYDLGGWPPDATLTIDAPDKTVSRDKVSRVHFWVVPARIGGVWQGEAGGKPLAITFRQEFQHVAGSVRWAERDYPFEHRKVVGGRVALEVTADGGPAIELALSAQGDRLWGTLRASGVLQEASLRRI